MKPFWEGFLDGLLISAVALGALGAGAFLWIVLASITGGVWAFAIMAFIVAMSVGMGIAYDYASFDPLDDDEDADSYWNER